MAPFLSLGPHLRGAKSDASRAWARNCHYVKALDDPTLLDDAPAGAITSFRLYMGNGDQQWQTRTGAQCAELVISKLQGRHPTFIEGANEVAALGDSQQTAAYIAWMHDFTNYAHDHGQAVAGFSYSEGRPSENDFLQIARAGFAGVDAFALHCYWFEAGPTELYHANRYRYLTDLLQTQIPGLPQPPFLITECGREYGGWKNNGQTPQQAVDDFLTYDRIISASQAHAPFEIVLGAAAYTTNGFPGQFNDFQNFDIQPLAPILWPGTPAPNPTPVPNPNPNPIPTPIPTIAGIPLPLAIVGGLAIGALVYALIDGSGGGSETIFGASDVQVIGADQPIPPGYFQVDL